MFKDYVNAVVNDYREKVDSNNISLNLYPLTPANVKKECKAVCQARFRKTDERMLSAFFGQERNKDSYLQAIERCEIDKFRPMINFVEGRSKETDQKNVELLAWLIDFKDRPFDLQGRYGGAKQSIDLDEPQVGTSEDINRNNSVKPLLSHVTTIQPKLPSGEIPTTSLKKSRSKTRIWLVALVAALSAGTAAYVTSNNRVSGNNTHSGDSCMYWKDDHYERISCSQKVRYSKVIALDPDLLQNFKKITRPDTITYNSIGKVWYIKIKGKVEYYTDMGYHPLEMKVQLKPITKYIIDTHIRQKTLSKDSLINELETTDTNVSQPNNLKLQSKRQKTASSNLYGRCQAITKANSRCLRNAKRGGYCWQHGKRDS